MRTLLPVAAAVLLAGGAAGATVSADRTDTSASGYAVKVVVPGQPDSVAAAVVAPPDAAGAGQAFAYPSDGSVVQTGGVTAAARSDDGATADATASADVAGISLFGGEIEASLVSARVAASAGPLAAGGDTSGSTVRNLVILGQAVAPSPNLVLPLADWGSVTVLEGAGAPSAGSGWHGSMAALDVRVSAAHGNLPAGSEILVGYAEAAAQSGAVPLTLPDTTSPVGILVPAPTPQASGPAAAATRARPPGPPVTIISPTVVRRAPPGVHPKLTAGRYVFPVYGDVSFTDTFGANRSDATYHYGDDLFAPLGTPILAAADGRVSSVGWNRVGGNRLWLQDGQGNRFYYAHLSVFSPAARNGNSVQAGTVLGFVGNTGDAGGTPFQLYFEVHPVSLLYLGYDGVVDPTPYLAGWQHLRDATFTVADGWVPPAQTSSPAPRPGAILLGVSDISTASGLDPGALRRAMTAPVTSGVDGVR